MLRFLGTLPDRSAATYAFRTSRSLSPYSRLEHPHHVALWQLAEHPQTPMVLGKLKFLVPRQSFHLRRPSPESPRSVVPQQVKLGGSCESSFQWPGPEGAEPGFGLTSGRARWCQPRDLEPYALGWPRTVAPEAPRFDQRSSSPPAHRSSLPTTGSSSISRSLVTWICASISFTAWTAASNSSDEGQETASIPSKPP